MGEGLGLVPPAPPVPIREVIRRFWPDLRPDRRLVVLGLICVALLPLIETVEIWLFQRVVDDVLVPRDLGPFLALARTYLALNLGSGVLSFGEDYLSAMAGGRFLLRLRTRVFGHVQSMAVAVLDRARLGDVLSRLTGDVAAIEALLLGGIARGLSAVLRIIFFTAALFLLDWQLAIIALIVAPAFWGSARTFSRLLRRASREKRRRTGMLTSVAEESLAVTALVQSYGRQQHELEHFRRTGEDVLDAELSAARVRSTYPIIVNLVELAGLLGVIMLGTWALAEERLTLGGLLVFLTYLAQLYRPVRDLGDLANTAFAAAAGAERVLELLNQPGGVTERPYAHHLAPARGRIELDRVTVRYPGASHPALRDVSLRAYPSELVALVGPSGAGKSTVARLLVRLADPDAGAVRLDGHDLRDLTLASVRRAVAVLLQDAPVLDASVRDNIAFARPEATDAQIRAAAVQAGAEGFVTDLSDGYDTRVGQKGRSLSGGQRQRLALARALLRDAPVLVFDEPTTGLDHAAAAALLGERRRLARQRCVLVVTHDPTVMAWADRVIALDRGRVVDPQTAEILEVTP
ncbi:ABC transporter ATP-binding protein [soil metagenome]